MEKIYDFLVQCFGKENIYKDEPMSKHTTFKVGGPADYFVIPQTKNKDGLIEFLKYAKEQNIPYLFLGNGSNTLVTDKGIRGIVISLKGFSDFEFFEDYVYVSAGMSVSKLSKIFADKSYAGLEFACGIPGTVGGAIFMNAGAYGGEFKDLVIDVEFLDLNDYKIKKITNEEAEFGYRHSAFQDKFNNSIILGCNLKLISGEKEIIESLMKQNMESRNSKQPVNLPSAGSTFRREEGIIVAKLIDEAGLKGYKIGGAEVSKLHAGFIVNSNNATSKDIIELIDYVKKVVKEKFNVELHEEIKILGER